jgi:hypothetical protein
LSISQVRKDLLRVIFIDILKIQQNKEEVLTLLSGSESNSISNIKLTTPMHTALIVKEQAKIKEPRLREKGLSQPHYSIKQMKDMIFSFTKKISKILNN